MSPSATVRLLPRFLLLVLFSHLHALDDDTGTADNVLYAQEAYGVLLADRHRFGWSPLLKMCLPAGRFLSDFK